MIEGTDIVGALLLADADVRELVPEPRIKSGALPDNIALPALLVRQTSSVERQTLKRGTVTRTVDRVSVAVRAKSYREQKAAIRLVNKCCAGRAGDIGGGMRVSILNAGTGPDVRGPGDTYERTIDFRVSYDA